MWPSMAPKPQPPLSEVAAEARLPALIERS